MMIIFNFPVFKQAMKEEVLHVAPEAPEAHGAGGRGPALEVAAGHPGHLALQPPPSPYAPLLRGTQ